MWSINIRDKSHQSTNRQSPYLKKINRDRKQSLQNVQQSTTQLQQKVRNISFREKATIRELKTKPCDL